MFDDFVEDDEYQGGDGAIAQTLESSLRPPRENPDLFGHEQVEKQILDLFEKKTLPHAMVFSGPMGIGKTTMAFRLARFLLSQKAEEEEGGLFGFDEPPAPKDTMYIMPDNATFSRVASGGHPDLRYVERPLDEKKGTRKGVVDVESVRAIAPFLRMKSAEGGWRVVIVDEADMMNRNAQNAILKILEEPPPKALLILICNRLGAMLPTIRSRCRTFHFAPLDSATMATLLKRASPSTAMSEITLLSTLSDGSAGRALSLLEEGGVSTLNTILQLLSDWPEWRWSAIHPMADHLSRSDAEKAYLGFAFLVQWAAQGFLKGRAIGPHALPEILKTNGLEKLYTHYSLEQWNEICEKLREHFITIENSNLDRRQGVMGAFTTLGGQ